MSEYFDVFFHQQAMNLNSGTVPFTKESTEAFLDECDFVYERLVGDTLSQWEKEELQSQFRLPSSKKYIEIQFFQMQLDVDALLEELTKLFPQFIWIKVVEEVDDSFCTYYCEFVPLAFDVGIKSIEINLFESLKQMDVPHNQTISELVEECLEFVLKDEKNTTENVLSFPVNVLITESENEDPKPKNKKRKKKIEKPKAKHKTKGKKKPNSIKPKVARKNTNKKNKAADKKFEKEAGQEVLFDTDLVVRSEKSEILFLKESLKQEQNSKQRMKIVKDKLEEDLLAAENSMLKSSITQYKKINRQELKEAEWYKPIRIDFVKYDEICKKAKFLEQIWNLNKELVEVFNSVQETSYDQERVAKIKRKVSKTKMLTWIEQSKRIFSRAKIRPGILFIKPSVKLYKVDYEQLERMSALFDIIQAENSFLERVLDDEGHHNQLDD